MLLSPESRRTGVSDALCVVIPAHNEELLIERCIRSVLDAGVPPHQIYVVDDRSADRTAAVVSAIAGVRLLSNGEQLGKQRSIRRAVTDCDLVQRYEFIALLDADSYVARDYFTEVIAQFGADDSVALVCGAPHSEPHNWLTAYRALEYALTLSTFRPGQHALGAITVAPGCASTYRTRILPYLDWDARTLVEDMDWTIQIHRKRLGRIAYTRFAVAYTQDPRTLRQYIGQLTRWYSGTWQVMKLRRLPLGGQAVDAEFAVLAAEGLAYAGLWACAPLLILLKPMLVARCLLLDQVVWFGIALLFAVLKRRADIVLHFPAFLAVRAINCSVLLATFIREVIAGKTRHEWFSVSRYAAAQRRRALED